jgi:Holliday junction resolvasome RuvABC endonuclease subunit
MNVKIVGIDPAIRNFGYAQAIYNTEISTLVITKIGLVTTEKDQHTSVRRNSDDFSRAQHHTRQLKLWCAGSHIAIVELPTGTQSARGAMSNGICIGIVAGCPIPVIQVMPDEVKLAAVGHKQAAKEEMIEWAREKYPHLPWLQGKVKGKIQLIAANEHLADAVAAIHAGIQTEQFAQARAMMSLAAA